MHKLLVAVLVGALSTGIPLVSSAAAAQQVQFAKGKSGASVSGKVSGNESADYEIRSAAGQKMTVDFKASKGAAFFNVLPPGSSGEAIFVGSRDGDHFEGELPADGVYILRVYLMGGAKDSGKPVRFTLKLKITGGATGAKAGG